MAYNKEDYSSDGEDYAMYASDDEDYSDESDIHDKDNHGDEDNHGISCYSINSSSISVRQSMAIQQVCELLGVQRHHARTVLMWFRWDIEKLSNAWVEKGEDVIFKEAGVTVRAKTTSLSLSSLNLKSNEVEKSGVMVQCGVCFEDFNTETTLQMDCDHEFCNTCWSTYLVLSIEEGKSRRLTCMSHGCRTICNEDNVRKLIPSHLAMKYDTSLLDSYVEDNSKVKWCPSAPHCGNALELNESNTRMEVECICGEVFCFKCAEQHSLCSCEIWGVWKKTLVETNLQYVNIKTRQCPHCEVQVEKMDGCNHITCICRKHFCWLCGEKTGDDHTYDSIGGHTCGKYISSKDERVNFEKTLERFNHYVNHWWTHSQSLEMERRYIFEPFIKYLDTTSSPEFGTPVWLGKAHSTLVRTRRALANSYPLAYYMFDNNVRNEELGGPLNKDLFEDKQQRVAAIVESLSQVLQKFNSVGNNGFMAPGDDAKNIHDQITAISEEVKQLTQHAHLLCEQLYVVVIEDFIGSLSNTYHYVQPYNLHVKATPFKHQ